ncbi:MAG: pyrroline-5-carboxylate reductase [Pseudoflavonifractor sp.]
MELKLGLIGAGNMASAIMSGILQAQVLPPDAIYISNRHADKLEIPKRRGVHTTTDNKEVARAADLIILGIKPQMFSEVLPELAPLLWDKCVVSISPGYSINYLNLQLPGCHIVRAMPNTPLLVGKGVTAIAEAPLVPAPLFDAVVKIFSAAGEVSICPEAMLDAAIAVSGSSPAYFFRMADAMVKGAQALGMDPEEALRLTALTMEGAAKMLLESGGAAGELTKQVCSPGGTTLAALTAFDEFHFEDMISQAMARCVKRSQELGK